MPLPPGQTASVPQSAHIKVWLLLSIGTVTCTQSTQFVLELAPLPSTSRLSFVRRDASNVKNATCLSLCGQPQAVIEHAMTCVM